MKINPLVIFICWLIGVMVSFYNVRGIIAVTCMAFILIWIWFFDDSLPVNPTHIQYDGKRFKTLTQLIKYVKTDKK